jgi:hypothetical protein
MAPLPLCSAVSPLRCAGGGAPLPMPRRGERPAAMPRDVSAPFVPEPDGGVPLALSGGAA